MTKVYLTHPGIITDPSMARLAAFPIGRVDSYAEFKVALAYYLAALVREALEFGEDVSWAVEQTLGAAAPDFSYPDMSAREVQRLLSLPSEDTRLGATERAAMARAVSLYAYRVAEAILDSGAGQAFLTDVATGFAGTSPEKLAVYLNKAKDVLEGRTDLQADREAAAILQAQTLANEHHADLNLLKYLESLILYIDR